MASYNTSMLSSLVLTVCLISLVGASSSKKGGITVDLIHRDSLHSPTYDSTKTHFERVRNFLNRSFSRKSHLKSILLKSTPISARNTFEAPISRTSSGEYLIKIQLGTPPVDVMAIADTGSDLTWTQCQPCTQCYQQTSPLFDPSKTSTYRSVSCESEQCTSFGSGASCDSSNSCIYKVRYGDGSRSVGDLAVETLSFGHGTEQSISFPKVVFGCGHSNTDTVKEPAAAGIVGLGGGSVSIMNQLSSSIGGRFSYCLTLFDSEVSSKMNFGTNAVVTGPNVVSTPIVRKASDTFYFLTLEGVSVGNKRVSYESNSNFNAMGEEGNIIIDSGTTLTYLPSDMYNGLESELVNVIPATRASDSQGTFSLCYQLPSDPSEFNPPPVIAHFAGADVELPHASTFIEVEQGLVCLTLAPSDDLAIFGNLHQMNYHIGYDLEAQTVSFLKNDCSKSV